MKTPIEKLEELFATLIIRIGQEIEGKQSKDYLDKEIARMVVDNALSGDKSIVDKMMKLSNIIDQMLIGFALDSEMRGYCICGKPLDHEHETDLDETLDEVFSKMHQ